MKKRFSLATLLILVLSVFSSTALATDNTLPPEDISPFSNHAFYEWRMEIMPFDDDFAISLATASISKLNSTTVSVRAETAANRLCASIGGNIRIQQWKNGKWNNYDLVAFTFYNTADAIGSKSVTVEPGYYYRLSVTHRALAAGSADYALKSSVTSSLYVN